MPSLTRHPTGQDLMCLVCLKPAQDIDHVVNRGMGGSKERDVPENKVPLCRECHDLKTVGTIETYVDGRDEFYQYHWRRQIRGAPWISAAVKVSKRYKCLVLSDGAEAEKPGSITTNFDRGGEGDAGPASPRGSEGTIKPDSVAAHTSAPSPSTKEESDGEPETRNRARDATRTGDSAPDISNLGVLTHEEESDGIVRRGLDTDVPSSSGDAAGGGVGEPTETGSPNKPVAASSDNAPDGGQHRPVHHSSLLTHEQRVAIAEAIKDTEGNRQWYAGDTANAWRQEMGEEAEQYISDFGYAQESIANIMYVCESIPKNMRRDGLRFSHHVVMLGLNREDVEMWLDKCEEEQWSVAEFRRQVKGTKKKVKRWSLEELREALSGFEHEPPQSDEAAMVSTDSIVFFLDYLEEQA